MRHRARVVIGCVAAGLLGGVAMTAGAQKSQPTVKLVLLGQSLIEHDPRGLMDAPIASVLPMLKSADVVFTNFEGVVSGPGCICKPTRGDVYQHNAQPEIFDFLNSANVSLLSLANNHAWDYGTDGVVATRNAARYRGLKTAGTGRTLKEAMEPAITVVNGLRIAMLAMATVRISDSAMATESVPGVNLLRLNNKDDWSRNIEAIKAAKKRADVVIVYQHFQTVGTLPQQKAWAHAAIDAGATLYVAHGEPQLFGVEKYHGRPILYGLGNFIFQTRTEVGHYPPEVWQSAIAELSVGRSGVSSVRLTPIVLDEGVASSPKFLETRGFPHVAPLAQRKEILNRLSDLSTAMGTHLQVDSVSATLSMK